MSRAVWQIVRDIDHETEHLSHLLVEVKRDWERRGSLELAVNRMLGGVDQLLSWATDLRNNLLDLQEIQKTKP